MRGFKQENVPLPPRILKSPEHWRLERWLVKPGASVHREQRIATFRSLQNAALEYAHAPRTGKLVKVNLEEQSLVDPTICPLASLEFCPHSVVFKGICAVCGETAQSLHFADTTNTIERIQVAYASEQLAVSRAEAQSRASVNAKHLLQSRRLSLVLDLDHTLLHATDDPLAPMLVRYFSDNIDLQSVKNFHLGPGPQKKNSALMHVKLRPHLAEFLQRLSKKFELHIYTMGTRSYAAQIANIIDPHKKLFGGRITSREDFAEGRMNQKSIQRLFPCDDSMVLIVDDREDVWISGTGQSFMPNLIRAQPFHFWDGLDQVYGKMYFRNHYYNMKEHSDKNSRLDESPPNASETAASQAETEKEDTKMLDASKPSENGNEVKHINGIISDAKTLSEQRNKVARLCTAQRSSDLTETKQKWPASPDIVTGTEAVGTSEHIVEKEGGGVALNGNSPNNEQNRSSSDNAKPDNMGKLKNTKDRNQAKLEQTVNSEVKTAQLPVSPNGVVEEKYGSVAKDDVGGEGGDNVEENPSKVNQQSSKGSSAKEHLKQPKCLDVASKDEILSVEELLQRLWTKYIESKVSNHLLRLADVLEDCHARFFSIADHARTGSGSMQNGLTKQPFRPPADVKKILASVRREVLTECVVSFTGVIPTGVEPCSSELWNLAQRLGARCSLEFENGRTTHLVASEERGRNTRKYKQAVESGSAFVVSPSWLEHCAIQIQRQDEFKYQLDNDNRFKTSEEFKSWVSGNFAKAASACRKRSAMQISDKQSEDERMPKRRKLDSPSPSVRGSGSRSPVVDGGMLSLLSQDEIGAAIEAAFAAE